MTRQIPMLFSAPMIRALLDGTKTETRRILKPQPPEQCESVEIKYGRYDEKPKPIQPGNLIWCKETFRFHSIADLTGPSLMRPGDAIEYLADGERAGDFTAHGGYVPGKTRSSIHMPRLLSRITLRVTDVAVERLQDINEEGALAEGCRLTGRVEEYADLWNSINGAGAWDANPWVNVIRFEVIKANILDVVAG